MLNLSRFKPFNSAKSLNSLKQRHSVNLISSRGPFTLTLPKLFTLSLLSVCLAHSAAAQESKASPNTLQVSPPNWWAGMKTPTLELMVHGDNIGRASVTLDDNDKEQGVTLIGVQRGHSPNYLFVTLDLQDAAAGEITLNFNHEGEIRTLNYRLNSRSENRVKGYDNRDVIYLITPDRFANGRRDNDQLEGYSDKLNVKDPDGRHGGDLQGIRNRLPYLADLGITQLWLNPVLENNQPKYSYHGYSITDHYLIDPRLGTNDEFLALTQEARQLGIGMIMDIVLNHIGSGHDWMKDLPFNDWLNPEGPFTSHRRTAVQDPYATESDKLAFTDGWFTKDMPDLNQRNPNMARFLIQHTLWWIETAGLSGLRIDTWSYSDKAFLTAFSKAILNEYPQMNIVGEEWTSSPVVVSYWQAGKQNPNGYDSEVPGLMDFALYEILLQALNENEDWGTGFIKLYEALANDNLYPNPENLVLFEGNHDTNRLYSLLGKDMAKFKIALAYVLLSNRVPQIFYGTEFAMQSPTVGRNDGAVRADMPMFTENSISQSAIDAMPSESKAAHAFIRSLLQFRKESKAVHQGRLVHFVPENGVYVQFRLSKDDKSLMIIFNKNKGSTQLATERFADFIPKGSKVNDALSGNTFTLSDSLAVSEPVMVLEF